MSDILTIAGVEIGSRLLTGSGKYSDERIIKDVLTAGECDVITVALRRVDLDNKDKTVVQYIPKNKQLMPNTSGARTADEAVRIAKLARAMGYGDWIKIEVIADQAYLLPDNMETLKATEILANDGFKVFPYMLPDLTMARRMADAGAVSIMPLAAPIGSNGGLQTKELIRILIEQIELPIIVDAGIGKPSHACEAMEMGAAAILLNTAIASAADPVRMASAFKDAIRAGRSAYLAGMGPVSVGAQASSPLTGFLGE